MDGKYLRFGIPALDSLIRTPKAERYSTGIEFGDGTVSICISGPAGTGKSVLALHLASHYAGDLDDDKICVIYASTDLSHKQAENAWTDFDLRNPDTRLIPFVEGYRVQVDDTTRSPSRVALAEYDYNPDKLASYILHPHEEEIHQVGFIDLQRSTAGDDWGFLNRLVASLPDPSTTSKHLLVVDAVEGLETLAGNIDSFGVSRARRSRIAQILRTAGQKCHLLFIVEDLRLVEREIEENPEEYVTDIVLRLSNHVVGQYRRRVVEAVKVRFGSHLRGEHQLLIRNGEGSTTGEQVNSDDPRVFHQNCVPLEETTLSEDERKKQGYVHVVRSLHAINRQIMRAPTGNRPAPPKDRFADFGIRHLDNMLAKPRSGGTALSFHSEGLPCGMLTALIGDEGTQKSRLGHAFIARAFAPWATELWNMLNSQDESGPNFPEDLPDFISKRASGDEINAVSMWDALGAATFSSDKFAHLGNVIAQYFEKYWNKVDQAMTDVVRYIRYRLVHPGKYGQAAVYLCTQDFHATILADLCIEKLCFDLKVGGDPLRSSSKRKTFEAAMRILIQHYLICRRLEIHDLSSAMVAHVIEAAVRAAQSRLIPSTDANDREERFRQSSRIRLVIDDFRLIRDTYPDVREDPLFLPYLRFYLGREGVTALLVDSHPGRPDVALADRFDSELRAIVDHRLYTWRIPFQGYSRVAIAAVPPIGTSSPVLVRELTSYWEEPGDPLYVDPRLELWDGLLEGNPKRVALSIKLSAHTPFARRYADQVNVFLKDLFTPFSPDGRIVPVEPPSYESLRTLCYLQTDVQLDHSLIFTVDEFWGGDRETGLRDCREYLNASPGEDPEGFIDPHDLFVELWSEHPSPKSKKHEHFTWPGTNWANQTDRIPYTWDFGFLFCQELAWREAYRLSLPVLMDTMDCITPSWRDQASLEPGRDSLKGLTVRQVAEVLRYAGQPMDKGPLRLSRHMEPDTVTNFVDVLRSGGIASTSWRVVLEACSVVAAHSPKNPEARKVYAFDVDLSAPETFSCLILEMWMSEIMQHSYRNSEHSEQTANWLMRQKSREYCAHKKNDQSKLQPPSLQDLLTQHPVELFSVFILLAEVFEENQFAASDTGFEFMPRECHPYSVATRHWYSTACHALDRSHEADRLMAVSLPGSYSVRGDWFLATAEGSRSRRLTDEALDLLSSRRSNYDRLQLGVGLPTRDILAQTVNDQEMFSIRTALAVNRKSSRDPGLTYEGLKRLGARQESEGVFGGDFHWLWRSEINHYDRDRGLWLKWLWRVITSLVESKREQSANWSSGFKIYDQIWYRSERESVMNDSLYQEFSSLVNVLINLLPRLQRDIIQ